MKEITIERNLSNILTLLIAYFIILILTGLWRVNIITNFIPKELVSSANISAWVSLIISSLISIFILCAIICIIYFCNIVFSFDIREEDILDSFKSSISVFIIFLLLKFIFTLALLENNLSNLFYDDNFIDKLRNTNWFFLDNILTNLMLISASLIYVWSLYFNRGFKNIRILMILFFIMISGLYITTIDIFGGS